MQAFVASHFASVLVVALCVGSVTSAVLSRLRHDSVLMSLLHAGLFLAAAASILYHYVLTVTLLAFLFPAGAQNALATWVKAALGKEAFDGLLRDVVTRGGVLLPILSGVCWALFLGIPSALLVALSRTTEWGYWIGLGMLAFSIASGIGWVLSFARVWWRIRRASNELTLSGA